MSDYNGGSPTGKELKKFMKRSEETQNRLNKKSTPRSKALKGETKPHITKEKIASLHAK